MSPYTASRFQTIRRRTRVVDVGGVGIGGDNPLRVQSMTTTNTMDVEATTRQTIELIEAGSELVRITAPNRKAAAALREISRKVRDAGYDTPLVADIHFLPAAAMEAVEHVEKVRVNPGNYADRKKFEQREYSDNEYESELQRLYEKFSPLVKRAKELGRAMRIGTNHGSLSDRIMNRYGDSPLGMVESALEFIQIAESHGYRDIILSMKASNPKVMIQAYRLAVAKMLEEDMHYPLHLGVTEAGDGEDARIKSAIGIGSLLVDGLGDTIRVSLTENPVREIPVCLELKKRTEKLWNQHEDLRDYPAHDSIDAYTYTRRPVEHVALSENCNLGELEPPRVIIPAKGDDPAAIVRDVLDTHRQMKDARIEGLLLQASAPDVVENLIQVQKMLAEAVPFFVIDLTGGTWTVDAFLETRWPTGSTLLFILPPAWLEDDAPRQQLKRFYQNQDQVRFAADFGQLSDATLQQLQGFPLVAYTFTDRAAHTVGRYRRMTERLSLAGLKVPVWIRCTDASAIECDGLFASRLIEGSILAGSLICDGVGDLISVEGERFTPKATSLAYNILQGAKARQSKTEYVACPSCGRTLFDLESTTAKIRARTGHLKNVTIAVMGCIVNGPGEMADADFGYVGGAPGRVNLYVGKTPVQNNIPETEAVERLVALIQEHGKWIEPED